MLASYFVYVAAIIGTGKVYLQMVVDIYTSPGSYWVS
jgi:hypothetical protein